MRCTCGDGPQNIILCERHAIEMRRRLAEAFTPVLLAGEMLEIAVTGIATTEAEKAVARKAVETWLRAAKTAKEIFHG